MKLKRGDRFGLPYHTQLKIYATCLNYGEESDAEREKIEALCDEIGGIHRQALFQAVTTEQSMTKVSLDHFVDESWLCRLCKRFYQAYAERG